jgi:hypothetical protein
MNQPKNLQTGTIPFVVVTIRHQTAAFIVLNKFISMVLQQQEN